MAGRTRRDVQDDDFEQDIAEDIVSTRERRKFPIIPVLILLLFIGLLVAIFGFNALNIRDSYIYPPLRGLPLVGGLIPAPAVPTEIQLVYVDGEYIEMEVPIYVPEVVEIDTSDLDEAIAELTAQLEAAQTALNQAQALNRQYAESNALLQGYRDYITRYRTNRRNFDEMIARGDPRAFTEFYASIDPENQARLYQQIRGEMQTERDFRRYASVFHTMNSSEAAAALTILLGADPALLVGILRTFNSAQQADVFNEMEPEHVAVIARLLVPGTPPMDILPEIPLITGDPTPIPTITAAATPEPEPEPETDDEEENEEDEEVEEETV